MPRFLPHRWHALAEPGPVCRRSLCLQRLSRLHSFALVAPRTVHASKPIIPVLQLRFPPLRSSRLLLACPPGRFFSGTSGEKENALVVGAKLRGDMKNQTTAQNNKPIHTLRHGAVGTNIWRPAPIITANEFP